MAIIVGLVALLGLSACGASSPSPSPSSSTSPPIADLTVLATHLGAQQAWWAALTPSEVDGLIGDHSWPGSDASPSATVYVELLRGDFNDAAGKPMGWSVAVGQAQGGLAATVMESRPEVAGHTWTALELPSPQASP